MKSRAALLLEKLCEDDNDPITSPGTDQAVDNIPGDTGAADDQPHDDNPDAPSLQDLNHPEKMADALDGMCDQCDRYMDEDDSDCWTPGSDDEKNRVLEARGMIRRAGQMMRECKRQ